MSRTRTPSPRPPTQRGVTALVAAALVVSTSAAHATATPEELCQAGREVAAANYEKCEYLALAKFDRVDHLHAYRMEAGACVREYAASWAELPAKASGSEVACLGLGTSAMTNDNRDPRFRDNGDGTVTDRLTELQWEKKTNLDGTPNFADPHDADNKYTWSADAGGLNGANGTAFMDFLRTLNSGTCFVGQCDWRLPTRVELLSIVSPAFPRCSKSPPCIDPVFGPTAKFYWSATTDAPNTDSAWIGSFSKGFVAPDGYKGIDLYVRAVRGGL
jgi:hypothetical protein